MNQGRKESSRDDREQEDVTEYDVAQAAGEVALSKTERDAEIDSLLDEIDDVLETNAESFVQSFIQKGGQ